MGAGNRRQTEERIIGDTGQLPLFDFFIILLEKDVPGNGMGVVIGWKLPYFDIVFRLLPGPAHSQTVNNPVVKTNSQLDF